MNLPANKLNEILLAIQLQVGPDIFHYPEEDFVRYISHEYLASERYQTDEVYRMHEGNLLHKDSGLRITYTTTEDYYGEHVEYKVIDLFIVTSGGERAEVVNVDFERRIFDTPDRQVSFTEVDRLY